jgi:Nickel responsive protein SCO4226-like
MLHNVPKFLDVHPTKGFDELTLKKAISEPPDEFGVTAENFLYNIEADRLYCILNAPNKEAIEKHHKTYNVMCEWIMEIKTSA